jgi:hypothetical protein
MFGLFIIFSSLVAGVDETSPRTLAGALAADYFFLPAAPTGFGDLGNLLGGLVHVVESGGGRGDGALDSGDGNVGTSRSGLGGLVEQTGDGLLEVAELGFDHLRQLFLGLSGNLIHGTRVGDGLFDIRLGQRSLDRHGVLNVLGAHQRLGAGNGIFHHGTCGVQIQGSDALGGSQRGVGHGQQGINGSLVGGSELLGGGEHGGIS